jgi:SSS family solute:Na+ symporter
MESGIIARVGFGRVDLAIVIVYLVGITVIGILAGYRRDASSEQFFLAGKSLHWPMIGAALFTANISTIRFVGLSTSGFSEGLAVGNFEWMASFCLIILALIFIPFYFHTKINTLPEFCDEGRRVHGSTSDGGRLISSHVHSVLYSALRR